MSKRVATLTGDWGINSLWDLSLYLQIRSPLLFGCSHKNVWELIIKALLFVHPFLVISLYDSGNTQLTNPSSGLG
jgi:hypothetical protein